jgi:hypothetical protein
MKKIFSIVLFLIIFFPLFSQNADTQITNYFPVKTGNTWTYTNGSGKLNETIFVQNSTQRDMPLYLFVDGITGLGQTSTMYGVENNKIVIVVTKNVLGQYKENRRPFPIQLAPAGQSWQQNESSEEYYLFKTVKSSIKYDDTSFDDCILVEQQIYTNNKLFMTKRSYFARNIGLVYVSLQESGKEETCYQKLIGCNFIDIKNVSVDDEISQIRKNSITAEMFFFIKFAENGLELFADMESKRETLDNNTQKAVFTALCTLAGNNISTILDMANSGGITISVYLNSPIPDFLITICLGNKPLAIAIDKAVKITVLSTILNSLQEKLKSSSINKNILEGTKEAEPLLANLYKADISNDDYTNISEPVYREYINLYLRHGGK